MANINDLFQSRFLKTYDLQGREPVVTIARVELVAMGWGARRETKPVVYFVGKSKGLKLNKTIATAIAAIAGSPFTERWDGVVLCLYATSATFGKDEFPVVRVKAPIAGPRLVSAPPAPPRIGPVPAATAPPAAAGTHADPSGYLAWLDTLRAAAVGGTAALERAWSAAKMEYRQHMATVAPGALEELRGIAGRLAGVGTRAS